MILPNIINSNAINAFSILPVTGQVIGLATVISNIQKIAMDCFALYKIRSIPDNIDNQITRLNLKENLRIHAIYAGIGCIRALPVVGGYALYMTETAPKITTIWKKNNIEQIVFTETISSAPKAKERSRVINLTLTMPILGQVVAAGLVTLNLVNIFAKVVIITQITLYGVVGVFVTSLSGLCSKNSLKKKLFEHVQYTRVSLQTEFLGLRYSSANLAVAVTAFALPVIGGATFYAADTHSSPPAYQYKQDIVTNAAYRSYNEIEV